MKVKCQKTIQELALDKLVSFSEQDITKRFVMPLLGTFGYTKVEYHGGAYEGGKDIICWRLDEIDRIELAVAQVKKYKPTAAASDTTSFSEIVTQLQQALEKKVPNLDGNSYQPSLIYFITPYAIDTRALESRFEGLAALRPRRAKIIDGPQLIDLLERKIPTLFNELIGTDALFRKSAFKILTNSDLLAALKFKNTKDISSFYCDLDFGLGNITTRLFLSLNYKPTTKPFKLISDEWMNFVDICKTIEIFFNISIISPTYNEIHQKYEDDRKKYKEKIKAGQREIPHEVVTAIAVLERIENEIEMRKDKVSDWEGEKEDELCDCYESILQTLQVMKGTIGIKPYDEEYNKNKAVIDSCTNKINKLEAELFGDLYSNKRIGYYLKHLKKLSSYEIKKTGYTDEDVGPYIQFSLNGKELAIKLAEKKEWLINESNKFMDRDYPRTLLKDYLLKCNQIIDVVGMIINNLYMKEILGISGISIEQRKVMKTGPNRLNISIDDVFGTGLNLIVLGEAGAGKTTTLQMYAKRNLLKGDQTKQYLFLPLARVSATLTKERKEASEITPINKLKNGIILYMNAQGINIVEADLIKILESSNVVLLLDGIDESISSAPWIIEAIKEMERRYPRAQLITSSRLSGQYLRNINFSGITLLPFTDDQREYFIKNWFSGSNELIVGKILRHIDGRPDLGNLVRNPLHATILCVLAEHEIPLPESEIQLYEERAKLLMGKYDSYKGIQRLKSREKNLELVAQKIAYQLHRRNTRYQFYKTIEQCAIESFRGKILPDKVSLAISELIDPCNILVPMTEDGQLGFGHLQFQEYLTACELRNNRGIEVGPLMYSSWWRGPLVFFAQLTDDIEFIIHWLAVEGDFTKASFTLNAMLALRPEKERNGLSEIVTKNIDLDVFNEAYDESDYYGFK